MTFYFLTLFPNIIESYLSESVLGRAKGNEFEVKVIDIRDFSKDKHKRTDDYPYGGGAGMLMTPQPIADAIKSIPNWEECDIIYPTPSGKVFNQKKAQEHFETGKDIIFICGHYEGIDQRIIDLYVDYEYTLGDYVLTGGELPALAISDAIIRYVPNVLGNTDSLAEESFSDSLLEYPQYTRPYEFEGKTVPDILLSGHHAKIKEWRENERVKKTKENRPELIDFSLEDRGSDEREN